VGDDAGEKRKRKREGGRKEMCWKKRAEESEGGGRGDEQVSLAPVNRTACLGVHASKVFNVTRQLSKDCRALMLPPTRLG
jgi:hypothetical protein